MQVDEAATDTFLNMRRGDQQRALELLDNDEGLQDLRVIKAPLLDLEVRGVPALRYFGDLVWTDVV